MRQLLDSPPSCRLSSSSALAMAGEIVYADLNIPGAFSTSKSLHPSQHPNIAQCPRWHRMALWLGCAGNVILLAAVIALGVWGQTGRQRTTNGTECNSSLKDSQSWLNQSLYPKPDNNSTEGCGCKLCPADWLSHKNKCYWVSKESKTWNESREDCSAKSSQMLMIQDKEEMAYVLNIPQLNLVWLGLSVTSPERKWAWVDGSTFDETLFQLTGAAERESCGMIKGNRTISETCTGVAKWICEKVALK
ncbi:killer cell lectin-like receptor subfamily B member 1B allele C isoform X1 [Chrysemys picta bellii]|uniref:killer cell lectin-like receptor subfamily B member 1B allele C isoform X1 n=2 Tax=Chrysemys picta bellii TaxID=8478 RepID=UPI0032B24ECB